MFNKSFQKLVIPFGKVSNRIQNLSVSCQVAIALNASAKSVDPI